MEVGLNPISKQENEVDVRNISYGKKEGEELFVSLLSELREHLEKYKIGVPKVTEDKECGMVYYRRIAEDIRVE